MKNKRKTKYNGTIKTFMKLNHGAFCKSTNLFDFFQTSLSTSMNLQASYVHERFETTISNAKQIKYNHKSCNSFQA